MADHKNAADIRNGRRSRGASPNEFSDDSSGEDSDHGKFDQHSFRRLKLKTLKKKVKNVNKDIYNTKKNRLT